jgi:hypothetical protein
MLPRPATLAAAGLLLLAGGADGSSSCAWKEGAPSGASFDLSPLLDQSFKVTGGDISCTTVLEQEYSYAFNLCGAVDASVLGVAGAAASCAAATGGGSPGAAVLQYDKEGGGSCKGAGRVGTAVWSLAEASDRSKGVKLSFSTENQGHKATDYCNTRGVWRKTDVKVLCDETATGAPNAAGFTVTEPEGPKGCAYEIVLRSAAGCPTQCGRDGEGRVCGGHGLCLTDTGVSGDATDDTARCFCNNGWGGDACASGGAGDHNAVGSDMGGAIALLVVLFLLMLGLGGVLWNLMKQVKGYRDDTANYLAIQEDGGVDGKF